MDPDDQQPKKITLANFFESIKDTNVVAQRALKLSSGLGKTIEKTTETVEVNKKDISELQKTVATISKDVTNIQDYIQEQQERRSRELDKREDEIFEKEDKLQKESKGNEGPLGKAKNFLDNRVEGGAGAIASAGLGPTLMGINALAGIDRNFTETIFGVTDKLTGNLFDLDRRNPREKNPLLGALDLLSLDILDLDKRGRVIPGVKQFMKFYEGTDIGKKETEILEGIDKTFDKGISKINEKNLAIPAMFGPIGLSILPFFMGKKKPDEKYFGTENIGGVSGPAGIDNIPTFLSKGETVISEDKSDDLKGMGFFKIGKLLEFLRNLNPFKDKKTLENSLKPDQTTKYTAEDYAVAAAIATEGGTGLSATDIQQVVQNRVIDPRYHDNRIDVLAAKNQFEGVFKRDIKQFREINNLESAAKWSGRPESHIAQILKDIHDPKLIANSAKFIKGALEFRGSPETVKAINNDNNPKNDIEADEDGFIPGSVYRGGPTDNQFLIDTSKGDPLTIENKPAPIDLKAMISPDKTDSNQDYSMSLAQRDDGGMTNEIEIREAIIQSTNDKGDGTGSIGTPPFDVADTGTPTILPTLCPFESAAIKRNTSNNAFV